MAVMIIDGYRLIESANAVRTRRNFPESKNRSKRILKKLLKRYGSETRLVPACYIDNSTMTALVHPDIMRGLEREFGKDRDRNLKLFT